MTFFLKKFHFFSFEFLKTNDIIFLSSHCTTFLNFFQKVSYVIIDVNINSNELFLHPCQSSGIFNKVDFVKSKCINIGIEDLKKNYKYQFPFRLYQVNEMIIFCPSDNIYCHSFVLG